VGNCILRKKMVLEIKNLSVWYDTLREMVLASRSGKKQFGVVGYNCFKDIYGEDVEAVREGG
jgi:hypothetical protein